MKNHVLPLLALIGVCVLFCVLFGCAHQCVDPWQRAQQHGLVLECVDTWDHKHGAYEECKVSTPGGDRTFRYRSCE